MNHKAISALSKFVLALPFLFVHTHVHGQDSLAQATSNYSFNRFEILTGVCFALPRGIEKNSGYFPYTKQNYSQLTGLAIGIGLTHAFSRNFGLYGRLMFEQKGDIENVDSIGVSNGNPFELYVAKYQTRNDYFLISVIPQWLLGKHSQFNIGVGPYAGYLAKSRLHITQFLSGVPASLDLDGQNRYDIYDYGLTFNAGYSFPLDEKILTFQGSCDYGFKQVSNFRRMYGVYPEWYTQSYTLMVGVRFLTRNTK
jgi:hypothetical protein